MDLTCAWQAWYLVTVEPNHNLLCATTFRWQNHFCFRWFTRLYWLTANKKWMTKMSMASTEYGNWHDDILRDEFRLSIHIRRTSIPKGHQGNGHRSVGTLAHIWTKRICALDISNIITNCTDLSETDLDLVIPGASIRNIPEVRAFCSGLENLMLRVNWSPDVTVSGAWDEKNINHYIETRSPVVLHMRLKHSTLLIH